MCITYYAALEVKMSPGPVEVCSGQLLKPGMEWNSSMVVHIKSHSYNAFYSKITVYVYNVDLSPIVAQQDNVKTNSTTTLWYNVQTGGEEQGIIGYK